MQSPRIPAISEMEPSEISNPRPTYGNPERPLRPPWIHRFSPLPEVAWKRRLRTKVENMTESSNKHLSHKCCAAVLCSNRSDNGKDLIFHAFPKDQILRKTWEIKMKRAWRQKICFQESPLLLFGALCRDGPQKEFDRCKARPCEKCRSFHFCMVKSQRRSESEVCESKNPWGQNDQVRYYHS